MRKYLIAGNWKMFKTISETVEFCSEFKKVYEQKRDDVDVAICAPFTQLNVLIENLKGTGILIGAQNVHFKEEGAFTGEVSVEMLKELGVDCCIVGHSERRQYFNETDSTVNLKLKALLERSDIIPILCVGEDLAEREEGRHLQVVRNQIDAAFIDVGRKDAKRVVIAYEPIWAIGTGRTATSSQADEMCSIIRTRLKNIYDASVANSVTVQYGGSVKPENSTDIMSKNNIDGALVGGASLEAEKFIKIVEF